jgi:hypothetical protein
MSDYIKKFRSAIRDSKDEAEFYNAILNYCSIESKDATELVLATVEKAESKFKKRYCLRSDEKDGVAFAVAISKISKEPVVAYTMPRDIEGLKESILETDGVGSLSLASTLMGSDSSKSFCEIFVVMKIAEMIDRMETPKRNKALKKHLKEVS